MYKRFLLYTLFSACVLLSGQFFLFRIPQVFDLSLKTFLYDNGSWVSESPKILLMGSSRCDHHIIPQIISQNNALESHDVANVGMDGATPFEMLITYKKMRVRNKLGNIQICFFVLDPSFFYESGFINRYYEKIFLNLLQWSAVSSRYENFYFFPSVIFYNAIFFSPIKNATNQGFRPLPHNDFLHLEKSVPQELTAFDDDELFPFSRFELDSLVELKKLVEEDGGCFVFVFAPVWDASSTLSSEKFRRRWKRLADGIHKEIGPVRVIGSWYKEAYDLAYEDFKDSCHLSLSGSKKFTNAVFSNVEKIAQQQPVSIHSLDFQKQH